MKYVLKDAAAAMGHVYLPRAELARKSAQLLKVPEDMCQRQIDQLTGRAKHSLFFISHGPHLVKPCFGFRHGCGGNFR